MIRGVCDSEFVFGKSAVKVLYTDCHHIARALLLIVLVVRCNKRNVNIEGKGKRRHYKYGSITLDVGEV